MTRLYTDSVDNDGVSAQCEVTITGFPALYSRILDHTARLVARYAPQRVARRMGLATARRQTHLLMRSWTVYQVERLSAIRDGQGTGIADVMAAQAALDVLSHDQR